jgi:hypothetical protein
MGRKKKTDAEKLAELLGIEPPKGNEYESQEDVSRAAEAALAYGEDANAFIRKTCKSCGRAFAHTRGAVAYCSNHCRARGLELIGISWNWTRTPEERWGRLLEPLVVPPEALVLIEQVQADDLEAIPEDPVQLSFDLVEVKVADALDILRELGLD